MSTFYMDIVNYYKDPDNRKKLEEWKKKKYADREERIKNESKAVIPLRVC